MKKKSSVYKYNGYHASPAVFAMDSQALADCSML